MNAQLHLVRRIGIVVAIVALLAMSGGCALAGSSRNAVSQGGGTGALTASSVSPVAPTDAGGQPSAAPNVSKAAESAPADRMIVSTASMSIQVDDVDKTLAAVRALAAASGSQITQLSVQAGDGSGGVVPLGTESASSSSQSGSAQVTLRVPAAKLTSVEEQAAKLGKVLTQSAGESDVTQQYVDLSARLKNLQAEEVRLRGFLDKATKVSEMLEIERELSRVRGDIEAMQAQIAYLEQQAAMATLTLSFSAPGALVQPAGGTWGFSTAVTTGVQAAAAVLRTLITLTIALSPVLLVVIVIVVIWRSRRRRRLAARAAAETDSAVDAPAVADSSAPGPTQ
ncbi:MAG: DUF4349 domain-containing protein [Coriobacteriia bacterium]